MGFKNFLKPTQEKIIIVFLIFLFTIFLGGITSETKIKSLEVLERVFSPHYFLYEAISLFYGDYWTIFTIFLGALAFLAGLFYWYLLACFIIFLYNKIKGRSSK